MPDKFNNDDFEKESPPRLCFIGMETVNCNKMFHKKLNQWDRATEYLEKLHKINGETNLHQLGLFIIQEGRTLQNNKE